MNIELKLTATELQYLSLLSDEYDNSEARTIFRQVPKQKKVVISICTSVALQILERYEKASRKPTFFNEKKRYKLNLQYHEAYAINVWLTTRIGTETDPYRLSTASKLGLMIDPLL